MGRRRRRFPYLFHPNKNGDLLPRELLLQIIGKTSVLGFSRMYKSCRQASEFIDGQKKYLKIYYDYLTIGEQMSLGICQYSAYRHRCYETGCEPNFKISLDTSEGTAQFWKKFFVARAFEYFHFKLIRFENDFLTREFIKQCEEHGTRCRELVACNESSLSEGIRILKPRHLVIQMKYDNLASNLKDVPHLEFNVKENTVEYVERLFHQLPKAYKGALFVDVGSAPPPTVMGAFYFCLQQILYGKFQLEVQIQWSVYHGLEKEDPNPVKGTILEPLEHSYFEDVIDDDRTCFQHIVDDDEEPLSVTIFPTKDRKFLVLLKFGPILRAKFLTNWDEFYAHLLDFTHFLVRSTVSKKKSSFKQKTLDRIRKLIE